MIKIVAAVLLLSSNLSAFINPMKDVCWECIFPMTVSGLSITPGYEDQTNYKTRFCACAGTSPITAPPKVGIPLTYWEPSYLIDVTRHPYKLIGLGGVSLGKESSKNRGSVGIIGDGPYQNSFYHVHVYDFPLLSLLELMTDFSCVEKRELDVLYMSELDPLWNDDSLSLLFNAEAALFANPAAHAACIADCLSPKDALFWCAGCQGSLYPFTGTVGHHIGALQASSLLVHRVIARMHRLMLQNGYEEDDFCMAKPMPIIKKSLYKTQIAYPKPQTKGQCPHLGKSDLLWGVQKSYPGGGEDFVYLLWVKKQCCLDAVKPAVTGVL